MKTKTVLILGGKDKGNDYNEIADLVKEKCSGLIFLGLHNEKLHDFFRQLWPSDCRRYKACLML